MASPDCIKKIWPAITDNALSQIEDYSAFLQYLNVAFSVFSKGKPPYSTSDLDTTLNLIAPMRQALAQNTSMKRNELVHHLTQCRPPVTSDLNSMCLCLSIWLTLNIVPPGAFDVGMLGKRRLEWQESSTIAEVINAAFPCPPIAQPDVLAWINPNLTIEYLHAMHDFKVLFIGNLAEHLDIQWRPNDRKPLIKVYKHKIFLLNELQFPQSSPLPKDLVQETLDTLSLLFPNNDNYTQHFLEENKMLYLYRLGTFGGDRHCDLNHYRYWRVKIARLSNIVEAGPTGFRTIMPGRNLSNIKESATFWVTVLLITVLTVASIVLGALSYVVGRRQLDLAEVQYKLSLAQACATMNSSQLPGWCL